MHSYCRSIRNALSLSSVFSALSLPFRSQCTLIAGPFKVSKSFSKPQESKDILVAVMAVFVAEPLVDWRNEALKRRAALGSKGRKGAVAALKEGDADEQMELVEQVRERRHVFAFCKGSCPV
jgi:hypothetical protein